MQLPFLGSQPDNAEARAEVQRAHTLVAQQSQKTAEATSSGSGFLANGLLGVGINSLSSTRRAVVRDRLQTNDHIESTNRGSAMDKVVVGSVDGHSCEDEGGNKERIEINNDLNGEDTVGHVGVEGESKNDFEANK